MTADVTPMRIGGELVTTDAVAEVRSPFSGAVVGRVPVGTEAHLDRAVAIALARHRAGALPAYQRAEILDRAATLLAERNEEFARSISTESAKPIKTARVEAARAVDTLRFSAAVARTLAGEMVPIEASSAGVGKIAYVQRVPIGVVAAISPFNFPLNLVCHKVGPAIAAGCPVVLKPASATPLTALRLASLLVDDCGLPEGWLNVVTCAGKHGQPPGHPRRRGHDHVHWLTRGGLGHPGGGAAQARRPRARQQRPRGDRARR